MRCVHVHNRAWICFFCARAHVCVRAHVCCVLVFQRNWGVKSRKMQCTALLRLWGFSLQLYINPFKD